jgi:hypothetical protein
MGVCLCVPFVFDAINSYAATAIYDASGSVSLPWFIGSIMDFLSLAFGIVISIIITKKLKR